MSVLCDPSSLENLGPVSLLGLSEHVGVCGGETTSDNPSGPQRSVNPSIKRPALDVIRNTIHKRVLEFVELTKVTDGRYFPKELRILVLQRFQNEVIGRS